MIVEWDGKGARQRRLPSRVWKEWKVRFDEWDKVKMRTVGKLRVRLLVVEEGLD